jgi:hypothetical protein
VLGATLGGATVRLLFLGYGHRAGKATRVGGDDLGA